MREKIVLRRRTSPKVVILPNGTTFTARYQRISRKELPINIHVKKVRKIGRRRRNTLPDNIIPAVKRLQIGPKLATQDSVRRIKKNYRNMRRWQTGSRLSDLAKIGLSHGSQAVNSSLGKKNKYKGINEIPNIFKYGVSKIKSKNIKRAMTSDVANMVVDEAQSKINKRIDSLFD